MIQASAIDAGASYPPGRTARDRYVLARRTTRAALDPLVPQAVIVEPERAANGAIAQTATVFLTGRECPWRCVMCDLWQHTTTEDTPRQAIPRQIAHAVATLRSGAVWPSVIKLYNAGSFFDPRAVPPQDDSAIVETLAPFTRVVVESHPALVGDRTWRLRDALAHGRARSPNAPLPAWTSEPLGGRPPLEVAMGLETAHPTALERLNKGITVEGFATAARALATHDVDLRVFLLIDPPFVPAAEQDEWLAHSIDMAFECGATSVSLIPTRPGNGAMEALAAAGMFAPPNLRAVERAAAVGLSRTLPASLPARGRVFVDTWDLARLATCPHCAQARRARLTQLNLDQRMPSPLACDTCGEVTAS